MITGLTMGAGNVLVLKKTLESLSTICDEIIYGDLLLWERDRELVESYKKEFNIKIIKYPFNYIFKNGFSAILNNLAGNAKNALTLYLNTSEIIEEDYGTLDIVKNNPDCNAFYFIHKTDPHRWHRLGDRRELKWSGLIHEQLQGEYRPYHKPIFMMADLPKDNDNPFLSSALDILKEIVYFKQYINIVENPDLLGETDPGWLAFAKADYESFKARLESTGELYKHVENNRAYSFIRAVHYANCRNFSSSQAIEYQNDPKFLNK